MDPNTGIGQANYSVKLAGAPLETNLVSLSVTTAVNRIPKASLEFNYRDVEHPQVQQELDLVRASSFEQTSGGSGDELKPGKELVIELGNGDQLKEVFRGYITRQRITAAKDGSLVLSVDCKHIANKLTLSKRTRLHHHDAATSKSGNDKIDKISDKAALEHLLQNSGTNLGIEFPSDLQELDHENLVQYECSDWDFLVMRAEAMALVCVVEAQKIRLIRPELAKKVKRELKLGENVLDFESEYDETKVTPKIRFSNWEISGQQSGGSDKNATDPSIDAIQSDLYVNHGGDIAQTESQAWVNNLQQRQQMGKMQSVATLKGTTDIAPGETASVSICQLVLDQKSFVSGIKHALQQGKWTTQAQLGLSARSHAEEFGLKKSANPVLLPETSGLLFGKVTGYKSSEGGHELIEVELPVANEHSGNQTIYARLATFSAGAHGGAVFRPYPDDEVVIGFVQNDPRFPIVLGALHNSKNKPSFGLDEDNKQQEVGFAVNDWMVCIDEKNKQLKVTSPDGQSLLIENEKSVSLSYDDQNTIVIDSEGITLKGSKIVIEAQQSVEISGLEVQATADTGLTVEAGTQLSLEGKVTTTLKGQITQIN